MTVPLPSPIDILESIDEAFYAIDSEWRFIYVNAGAERFWNRRRQDLIGRCMLEVFPTFPGSESHTAHRHAMVSGERRRLETISTVTRLPVELNLQPTAWGLAVYFRDITDRRRAEGDLRARDAVLTLAEESAGIGVWDVDLDTGLVHGTPQFFRIMGLPAETGVTPIQTMRNLRHPGDGERLLQGFVDARDSGKDDYEAEYRIVRPNGEVRWIFGRGKLIRDSAGKPVRYAGVDIDITERKRAEVESERLASIVESSDDAIVSKDLDGIIQTWNSGAARLFGYRPEEAIGRSITMVIPEDRLDEETDILARIRRGERVDHYETVRKRRDGTLIDISLTISPIRDARGTVVGASKIARDISARKHAENQQRLLLREMRHRVKNLFALAFGLVAASERSATSVKHFGQSMRDRLAALARAHELTLPSIDEQGKVSEHPTKLELLLETIFLPHLDPQRPDRIKTSGPDIEIGQGAVTGIALLLHELATNAAKHGALSSPEGEVDISWRLDETQAHIRWEERGGPDISGAPDTVGFGTRLSDATVVGQLGGSIAREWGAHGLTLQLVLPIERLRV
jgi:PAS domain S-box-containing protein